MIGTIIQARMGSSRLPGKVMKIVDNKNPMISYVIDQVKNSKKIEKIIVATSNLHEDDEIEKFVKSQNVLCYRGNSKDVLDRYYNCAKKFGLKSIVRISGDCPLIEPQIIDKVIEKFILEDYDYVSNNNPRSFPYGMDLEVFSFNVLESVFNNAKLPSEREHVTPYIYNNPKKFKIGKLQNDVNYSNIRLTVDRELDFKLIQMVISKINKKPILLGDIINLYNNERKIFEINQKYVTDEGYLKSLKEDSEFMKQKFLT